VFAGCRRSVAGFHCCDVVVFVVVLLQVVVIVVFLCYMFCEGANNEHYFLLKVRTMMVALESKGPYY